MKNLIFTFATIFFLSLNAAAQDKIQYLGNHELKFNIAYAIAAIPELDYEYILNDNMGVGLTAGFSIDKPDIMILRSEFIPNIRMYFGKNRASGFFIEANSGIFRINDQEYTYNPDSLIITRSINFGFGAAVGMKLLTKSNVVGEVILGGGRLFGATSRGGYLRMGVTMGYRFR